MEAQPDKPKFLKPHLHFNTSYIKIGDDYTTGKVAVTELVKTNTTLATFKNFDIYAKKGYEKAPLEPGENADYGEDGESIIATIAGYPKTITKKVKNISECLTVISVEPMITVSKDRMKAIISLHPPIENVPPLSETVIAEVIAEYGIVFGIDDNAMDKIKAIINEREVEYNKIPFAKGKSVGESFDSYLRFDIDIGPIAGTILEGGSIDFRDRRIMVGVSAEQRIATKIPAIHGDPGINVFGEETPARTPIDIKVETLNDAKFTKDKNQVIATKDGVLSIANNNVIKVLSHQVINGDVDYQTGNIDSKNAVTVQGSVQPGFKVHTSGDLKISGSIMSAYITSEANLVISGGITGKNSTITAAGDCDINFIEQGRLTCGGLCVIRKQSYYSDIIADNDIRCKADTIIMGGNLFSGGSITLFNVGGDNATPSVIAAGVVASRLTHYNDLKKTIVEQEEAIVVWLQLYKGSSNSKKIKKMEKEVSEAKLKRMRVNLIPGTGMYSRIANPDNEGDKNNPDYSDEGAIAIDQITIDVHGEIYRGTEVRIGNRSLKLEKTVNNRQFKLHPSGKRIIAVPLRKG